ncbi:MAG: fasciclin domain-containing protein, partial [Xanthomonadales bacterium]|nr:fasciclin domain-containing protein [Xanthomonadales bacterium]
MNRIRTTLMVLLAATLAAPLALAKGPKDQDTIVDVAIATRDALNADPEAPFTINTIVDVVAGDPVLTAALSRKGQRTVFAPTDEAFANLEALLNTLCLSIS